jgi:hypothetical protein
MIKIEGSSSLILLIMLVLLFFESFLLPYSIKNTDYIAMSLLYFFSGIGIATIPLLHSFIPFASFRFLEKLNLVLLVLFAFGFGSLFVICIHKNPVNILYGDMLPVIKLMAERFLKGEYPNAIMPEIWNGFQSVYLPFMWLPYCPSIAMGLDMRYTSVFGLFMMLITLFVCTNKIRKNNAFLLASIPVFFLFLGTYLYHDYFFTYTQEGVVLSLYLVLGTVLITSKNPYLIGISMAACILSRYSLLPWVSFYFLWKILYKKEYKFSCKSIVTLLLFSSFILFVTKAIYSYEVFLNSEKLYFNGLQTKWAMEANKVRIENGIGMVKFLRWENYKEYMKVFKLISIISPLAFCMLFYKRWNIIDEKLLVICCLKFTLVFFYNFFPMPFLYLFYTNTILSMVVFVAWTNSIPYVYNKQLKEL